MKKIIFITLSLISISSFAQSLNGNGTGGGKITHISQSEAAAIISKIDVSRLNGGGDMGGGKVINISQHEVEAIISKDDLYVRPMDLEDGIDHIRGVNVLNGQVQIDLSKPNVHNVGRIIFQNGSEARVLSGGAGGGG